MTRPMSANATTNGSMIAPLPVFWLSAASQEPAPVTVPGGSAPVTSARSARTWALVPALANRYSSCAPGAAPGGCRAATSAGATQPSAVLVMELAKPTTVNVTGCGNPVMMSLLPTTGPPSPGLVFSTTWPGPVTQRPPSGTTSSTGPPGEGRPTSVSCPKGWPLHCDWTVAAPNGPAIAVTPGRDRVAASRAGPAWAGFTVTTRCAPFWTAKACWNGPSVAASSVRPSVAEAVETSRTNPSTTACTLFRSIPPAAVLTAPNQFTGTPRRVRRPAVRPRSAPCGPRTDRPGPGRGSPAPGFARPG